MLSSSGVVMLVAFVFFVLAIAFSVLSLMENKKKYYKYALLCLGVIVACVIIGFFVMER